MSVGLLFDCEEAIANYVYQRFNLTPMSYNRAIGLVSPAGELIGGILFQGYNGANVDLSYYGERTLTPGIARCVARFLISTFNPARVTVNTSKRNRRLMRSLQKFGFKLEGAQRCFYGHKDCTRNTAIRFVAFRSQIEEVAQLPEAAKVQNQC